MLDAIVVGSGPNGLAAAVTLARAGLSVRVYERSEHLGGGSRTAELTEPGFHHDICSAVHPMAYASEFFQRFGLTERLEFITPEVSYANPLSPSHAALAWRDLERTAEGLGRDAGSWRALMRPLLNNLDAVSDAVSHSLLRVPRQPIPLARFAARALEQGSPLWNLAWQGDEAPALLTGVISHSIRPLPSIAPTAAGLVLAVYAHAGGWPIPVGGSQMITDALVADAVSHGVEFVTEHQVDSMDNLPSARAVIFDTSVAGLRKIAGDRMPRGYARALERYRPGNAAAKVDFALSGPIPWTNPELARTPTLHVCGTRADMARAENQVARGNHADSPYVLLSQPSLFDPTRAPAGKHAVWTYTHVPRGSTIDQTEAVTRQIERFAPGFRDLIISSSSHTAADLNNYNPNYIGGDIATGDVSLRQLIARPVLSPDPWRTAARGIYLCSAATPPGPGVHGLGGWRAALSALRNEFGIRREPDLSPSRC
ncbi:phytoene desaturase family protein [Paramicrobacterium agarici]|uniref:Phytoene dehydrogenase-like protein n=1 Tax=Paramicrobacterium agarici TaxID=630514 RepID=A0A2A9DWE3_9MICO|nr:NAD(P)/FAD-dependent oxidoreductase [Microbacterium agarici]PFG30260.1 phytoene dehydrogenase-like protein [Microbacterium agarici]